MSISAATRATQCSTARRCAPPRALDRERAEHDAEARRAVGEHAAEAVEDGAARRAQHLEPHAVFLASSTAVVIHHLQPQQAEHDEAETRRRARRPAEALLPIYESGGQHVRSEDGCPVARTMPSSSVAERRGGHGGQQHAADQPADGRAAVLERGDQVWWSAWRRRTARRIACARCRAPACGRAGRPVAHQRQRQRVTAEPVRGVEIGGEPEHEAEGRAPAILLRSAQITVASTSTSITTPRAASAASAVERSSSAITAVRTNIPITLKAPSGSNHGAPR